MRKRESLISQQGSSREPINTDAGNSELLSQKPEKVITYGIETPPLTLGPRRYHYQHSVLLPQVHLILVSVLQGVAFGVLLLSIPLPTNTKWAIILPYANEQYFYLPYLVSSILVLLIWKQFVYASMFSIWPLNTLHVVLIYLIALVETLAFRIISVSNGATLSSPALALWLFWLGCVGVVGGCIRLSNLPFVGQDDFDRELSQVDAKEVFKIYRNSQIRDGILYLCLGFFFVALGIIFSQMSDMLKYSNELPWVILGFLLSILITILLLDIFFRQSILTKITANSDLRMLPNGVLRYEQTEHEEVKAPAGSTETPKVEVVKAQGPQRIV